MVDSLRKINWDDFREIVRMRQNERERKIERERERIRGKGEERKVVYHGIQLWNNRLHIFQLCLQTYHPQMSNNNNITMTD